MRIAHIEIHNYRSIKHLELTARDLMVLLGPNNHGKSNVLAALEFALSPSKRPTGGDFSAYRARGDERLWVELTFEQLTPQERTTFKRYLLSDDTVCIRKTALQQLDSIDVYYNGWTEQPSEPWLHPENAGDYTTREAVNKTPLARFVEQSGRLTKSAIQTAQQDYIHQHRADLEFSRTFEDGPLLGQKNVGGGVLPEFFLIPAVRDLTDEIKLKNTATFGRLMTRAIREMAERDDRFIQAREQLQSVINSLNERKSSDHGHNQIGLLERSLEQELSHWGVNVNIALAPPDIEKLFELGTDIQLDDGVSTSAAEKGHGLQRATMFALLKSWATALRTEGSQSGGSASSRKRSDSVIFAMEEPELYLHPHAQRRLAESLQSISETDEHQVFISTHSTHFVDLNRYKEVAIVTKHDPPAGSSVRQCNEELFPGSDVKDRRRRFHMAQWINPDRGELFFARRALFVEGETEKVLLPYLADKIGVFDPEISIIDCGSKHNLPLYITLANAFGIPYMVVHDEDPLPDPIPEHWSSEKVAEKKKTFGLNNDIVQLVDGALGKVETLSPDFEGAAGLSRSQASKKGKALSALEHFEQTPQESIPVELVGLLSRAFA